MLYTSAMTYRICWVEMILVFLENNIDVLPSTTKKLGDQLIDPKISSYSQELYDTVCSYIALLSSTRRIKKKTIIRTY